MVTCDHDGANTCGATFVDCGLNLGTNGVDHADKTYKAEIVFYCFGFIDGRFFFEILFRSSKYAERFISHLLVCSKNSFSVLFSHGSDLTVFEDLCAAGEDDVGCALGKLNELAIFVMHGGHHLTHGVEGNFADADELFFLHVLVKTKCCRVVDERTFGGFADRGLCFHVKLSIRAERHRGGKEVFVVAVMLNDGHFVLCECTGLIGADDLCATECFYGGELTDDRISLRHIGNADGENDGNDSRKTFGNRRNGKRDRDHEGVEDGAEVHAFTDELNTENDDADTNNEVGEDLGKTCKLHLERCFAFLCVSKCVGDLTHFGIHTGRGNDSFASAVYDSATHEDHVLAVAEGNVALFTCGKCFFLLGNGNGFTCEGSFFDLHAGAFDDARVSWNSIACFKDDDIAHNEVFTANGDLVTVTDDLGGCSGDFL